MLKDIIREFELSLLKKENRAKAVQMEAYMKNLFPFLGISSPQRKDVYRSIYNKHKEVIKANWKPLVEEFWQMDHREFQMIAMLILKSVERKLTFDDLDFMMSLVVNKSWWDTVDFLASNPIGYIIKNNIAKQESHCKKWITDSNMWVQRVALIHQLKYKDEVNLTLLFYCVKQVADSKEFFLQKGAGWGLREASKRFPAAVKEFVENNPNLSGLTKREALRIIKAKNLA